MSGMVSCLTRNNLRWISMVLCLTMLGGFLIGFMPQRAEAAVVTLPINDMFDTEQTGAAPAGYLVSGSSGSALIVDPAGNGNKSIELKDADSGSAGVTITKSFTPISSGKLVFETKYQFKKDATNTFNVLNFNLNGKVGTNTSSKPVVSFSILNNGATRYTIQADPFVGQFIPSASAAITDNSWYTMKVVLDMNAGTYDVHMTSDQLDVTHVSYLSNGITREGPNTVAMLGKSLITAGISSIDQFSFATGANSGSYYIDDITVKTLLSVKGKVTNTAGEALGLTPVSLYAAADTTFATPLASMSTLPDGTYSLIVPSSGAYVVKANKAGYLSVVVPITVTDNDVSNADFHLAVDASDPLYAISGKVKAAEIDVKFLPGAVLNVYAEGDTSYLVSLGTAVTAADGSFTINNRLVGNRYIVRATLGGYMTTNYPLALFESDAVNADIRMPAAVTATAQTIPTPPPEHPRLYVRQGDIPALQQKIAVGGPMNAVWNKVIATSESASYLGTSSGTTDEIESYSFPSVNNARYVKIVGYGSSSGSLWNSIVETEIYPTVSGSVHNKLAVQSVVASSGDADKTIDGNMAPESRWSAEGSGEWLKYDLGSIQPVGSVGLAWYSGHTRKSYFDIYVSSDNVSWTKIELGLTVPEGTVEPLGTKSMNYSIAVRKAIDANALIYLLEGDPQRGRRAITMLLNNLNSIQFTDPGQYTQIGDTINAAAMVYDWCFDLLTEAEKTTIINRIEFIASQTELGYPVFNQGAIVSHGSGNQLLKYLLAGGVAIYDEKPNMYQHSALRFFQEHVPANDFISMADMNTQGDSYGQTRMEAELWARTIFKGMGIENVYNEQQGGARLYRALYERRPDGQLMRSGDSFSATYTARDTYWKYAPTIMLGASYYRDPYLQNEFLRQYQPGTIDPVSEILFVDMNLPTQSDQQLPLTKYFGFPIGTMMARTGWDTGATINKTSPAVIAEMKVGGYMFNNHQHQDMGNFNIYYKGSLALHSGIYEGDANGSESGYGKYYDRNYNKQAIANNTMLVYDPNETKTWMGAVVANDGGQRRANNGYDALKLEELVGKDAYMGKVLGHEFGPDVLTPNFSYLKGDLTAAYTAKVKQSMRSFVFLNLKNSQHPAAMIVYDKVAASNPNFKKYWLLHSMEEPVVNGNTTTIIRGENGYNSKLVNETLLPIAGNTNIEKVGGPGHEFEVFGTNYPESRSGPAATNSIEAGAWRVQISPNAPTQTDYFLNVMQVMDNNGTQPLVTQKLDMERMVGAKVADNAVFFSKTGNRLDGSVTLSVYGTETTMQYVVTDLVSGTWKISRNGVDTVGTVSEEGGVLYFNGTVGTYTLTYMGSTGVPAPTATLTGVTSVMSGQSFDVTYGLSQVTQSVYAQDVTLQYDATQYEFLSVESLQSGLSIVEQTKTPGQVRIIAASTGAANAVMGTADLLKLHFKAKEVTQTVTGSVYLTNVVVSDGKGIETIVNNAAAHQVQITFVEKAALQALLMSSQALHNSAVEGAGVGKYPAGAKAILQAAIDSAQAVANQSAATQLQVDQALTQLQTAVQTFTVSVNVDITGDLNGDGKVSIGDLGIVAAHYGSTAADPNWHLYKQADINNDGIINFADLAAVASLILAIA
ncbi:hypothetical protein GC096_32610 [Paenibacillus sp. LMG 31461]|uniref:Dockerin domain-containing protein n=2 Tax=Paenibacillus plantarum TaxID=2654975 RepID=A0ABX1XKF7_9BACL|nr:hypothetical protein [Paenibacillus plantarum]